MRWRETIRIKPDKENTSIYKMFLSVYDTVYVYLEKEDYDENYYAGIILNNSSKDELEYTCSRVRLETEPHKDNVDALAKTYASDIIQKRMSTEDNDIQLKTMDPVFEFVLKQNLTKINDSLVRLLLNVAEGCSFCLGIDEEEGLCCSGNLLKEVDGYYWKEIEINYCPMCGRKLDKQEEPL